jgi:WD40 repeat protein
VDRDQRLLAIARDCFYFVTRFFEVIKLSAPHIYHSALELSPYSAIVRKLYYHHRPHPTHWVVRGVPSSWSQPLTINTNYKFSTWSPCGKSLAVATPNNVEIWDILTLGKRSTLQPTNPSHKLWDTLEHQDVPKHSPSGIAYSPDGHSLACYSSSSAAIIIWDIQTGGVVNEICCRGIGTTFESLAWSSDGKTIGAIFMGDRGWVVCMCNIALGTVVSPGTLQSAYRPCLLPYDKSLQVLTILDHGHISLSIYEIGPPLLRIKSFSISFTHDKPQTISISPTIGQISLVTHKHMLVLNCQDSKVLLEEAGSFHGNCFSPNGGVLAAFGKDHVHIWDYEGNLQMDRDNRYHQWKKIPFRSDSADLPQGLQFSPTSSSVLISREGFLEVVHLDNTKVKTPTKPPSQFGKISANGAYIVTANWGESTITITNLCSQIPSLFIKIQFGIYGLALTGNILLVAEGVDFIVAWRLTADGGVEGVLGDRIVDWGHVIWFCGRPMNCSAVESLVTGDTGIIRFNDNHSIYYNIDTGERYESAPIQVPAPSTSWHNLTNLDFHTNLHYHSYHEHCNPPEDNQLASVPNYKEGWVKYPEGDHPHRFWLPPHWIADHRDDVYWFSNITTLWFHGNELIIIKF